MAFDTLRKKYGKEHFWFVEIDMDGTIFRFCENRAPKPYGLDATPSLKSVNVSPAEIDFEGGIGVRAKARITIEEHEDYTRWGSINAPVRFWSRWRAEYPYYLGKTVSVYSGYIENNTYSADNFIRRDYIFESFSQTAGGVSITAKDPLKLASNERAKAPRVTSGVLSADLVEGTVATSITLEPAGIVSAEYPVNGIIRIGDECMDYAVDTGDTLLITRGNYGTTPSAHSQGDNVQLCLRYNGATPANIDYNLLVAYAGVDASYIDKPAWDAESGNSFSTTYTALITEPTGVQELLKEFAQSAPHWLYWDERVNKIRFIASKPPPEDAPLLTYQANIIENTTTVQDMQDMRISRMLISYGILDPTKDLDEPSNYANKYIRIDDTEETNYGQIKYKRIYSRWISSDNKTAAVLLAARTGRRFAQAPRMIGFQLDPKDGDVWTGDSIKLQSDLIEENGGGFPELNYQILSAGEQQNYVYKALEHTYGAAVPGDEDVEDPNVRLIYISGNQENLKDQNGNTRTLRDLYEDVYGPTPPEAQFDVRFIFEPNCVAGASQTSNPAVRTGTWPELTTPPLIINQGLIVGAGGEGANFNSTPGNGGEGLRLENDIRLDNVGIIGGGGGGGEGRSDSGVGVQCFAAGGGGAGYLNGVAGSATYVDPSSQQVSVTPAEDGTNTDGGLGGNARGQATTGELVIAVGEPGGDLGQNTTQALAGKAIELNGFTITYVTTGDIRGTVS